MSTKDSFQTKQYQKSFSKRLVCSKILNTMSYRTEKHQLKVHLHFSNHQVTNGMTIISKILKCQKRKKRATYMIFFIEHPTII